MAPSPHVDGRGAHGGYCGPAVKPIALRMVGEIARDPECRGHGRSRHRRHLHLARRRRVHGAGRAQRAGVHRGDGVRLQDRRGHDRRAEQLDGRARATGRLSEFIGKAVPNFVDWEHLNLQYMVKARIDQDAVHPVRPLLHRLRGHLAPGHPQGEERPPLLRGDRQGMRGLQPVRERCARWRIASRWNQLPDGSIDPRTGQPVGGYGDWTTHPNNPERSAAPTPNPRPAP